MTIDWASLGLVAMTTVVATLAIVGIFSLGVLALTSRPASGPRPGSPDTVAAPSPLARLVGYLCLGMSGLLVLYGLYLIIPQFH